MTPIQSLNTLYTELAKRESDPSQGKIYLKVEGTDADRHVVVVTGFFSCLWARIASYFGSLAYTGSTVSEVLFNDIRVLQKSIQRNPTAKEASQGAFQGASPGTSHFAPLARNLADLFTKYIQDDRFATHFGNEEAKEKLTESIHTVVDEIIRNVQAQNAQVQANLQAVPQKRVDWKGLAKIEKSKNLLSFALKAQRDFISTLLRAPVEEVYGKKASTEKQAFILIRVKVESTLNELDKKVDELMKICRKDSLEYALYSDVKSSFQRNFRALQSNKQEKEWCEDLDKLKPLVEKYESLLVKLQKLVKFHEAQQNAPTLKAAVPSIKTPSAVTAFDKAVQEVSSHLDLNIKGSVDIRSAVIARFNEQYDRLILQDNFKSRGTISYHLISSIFKAFTQANDQLLQLKKDDPIEEKKQLYHMMQALYELKLLSESTQQP
ncbi:MAG TPA: hypothetical protein VN457_01280, partial [Chlamydiales bacterium]|nr:hypothetical protein [Chlamydiales bacterium]